MRKPIITLLFFLIGSIAFGQKDNSINQIRENFRNWQPIIEEQLENSTQLFHYVWGENYQEEKWYTNELTDNDKFLFETVNVIEKPKLGTFVYLNNYSISGDWHIAVDYYFDIKEKLYFIFWRMNTFQAEIPVTIEKRLYFNPEGELIKELQSNYKLNTKEESTAEFLDRDVEYELEINKMNFYGKLKNK